MDCFNILDIRNNIKVVYSIVPYSISSFVYFSSAFGNLPLGAAAFDHNNFQSAVLRSRVSLLKIYVMYENSVKIK